MPDALGYEPATTPRPLKQVIVMDKSLKMSAGKIGAQAAHAARNAFFLGHGSKLARKADHNELVVSLSDDELAWALGTHRVVTLAAHSEDELRELHAKAQAAGLRTCLVRDLGLTEFNGVSHVTALAIGPGTDERINALTGHLSPLR